MSGQPSNPEGLTDAFDSALAALKSVHTTRIETLQGQLKEVQKALKKAQHKIVALETENKGIKADNDRLSSLLHDADIKHAPAKTDLLLVGHVTKDLLSEDLSGSYRLGGTVTFAAVTAERLGRKPTIVTRAAADTDLSALPSTTNLHVLSSDVTTTFQNIYTEHGRTQYCHTPAGPITVSDIPDHMLSADAVLLGPLVNEVDAELASKFPPNSLVVAGPQGWMRRWDADGRVHAKPWDNWAAVLPHLDVLILSLEDIDFDLTRLDPYFDYINMIIVTEYRDGATIYQKENGQITSILVPPRPAKEVDPTGAGDTFCTSFMIRYQETKDATQAARFANICASFKVEGLGATNIPSRDEILKYMDEHPFNATRKIIRRL